MPFAVFSSPQDELQWYCTSCEQFLADRFVEGTCPDCGMFFIYRPAVHYANAISHASQHVHCRDKPSAFFPSPRFNSSLGYDDARGDQCDECGHPLHAHQLIVRWSESFVLGCQSFSRFSRRLHAGLPPPLTLLGATMPISQRLRQKARAANIAPPLPGAGQAAASVRGVLLQAQHNPAVVLQCAGHYQRLV